MQNQEIGNYSSLISTSTLDSMVLLCEVATGSLTLLLAAGLLLYPAALPWLADRGIVFFEERFWESVLLPVLFYGCLERIALFAPTTGAFSPVVVCLMYFAYLFSWRLVHESIGDDQDSFSSSETTEDLSSSSSSSSSALLEQEESGQEEEDEMVTETAINLSSSSSSSLSLEAEEVVTVTNEKEEGKQVQGENEGDVFTVLQKSVIAE